MPPRMPPRNENGIISVNMDLFEPITRENIHKLEPGEWIWDSKLIARTEHKLTLYPRRIEEPIGFRQVHLLDIRSFLEYGGKAFMLSDIDSRNGGYTWTYFEPGRFYRFKKEKENDQN